MKTEDDRLVAWLRTLGLEQHAGTFAKNDVTLEVLPHLSDDDLRVLGLSLGHRRVLQDAVRARSRQESVLGGGTAAHGECRQVTVMFCDLVGSSELSAHLDLDDYRGLIQAYYARCSGIVERAGGFVARLVGDGVLAYFGYPLAREDAAECALRAGLHIISTLSSEQLGGHPPVSVRIGVATGLSVISDMVGDGVVEHHAITGPTPNLAARIQALAPPGGIAVAELTRRLAGGQFLWNDMGLHTLKGWSMPVRAWQVLQEATHGARFDAHRSGAGNFLGRDAELSAVGERWAALRGGQAQLVVVTGEAGIGKSRLMREATERMASDGDRVMALQCSPHQSATPLHPLVAWIRREAGLDYAAGTQLFDRLAQWLGQHCAPIDRALLADLLDLPLPVSPEVAALPPDRKRELTRQLLLDYFERACEQGSVLLLVEDAHWMDGATEELLRALLEGLRRQPFMALITTRPAPPRDWGALPSTHLALERLSEADAQALLRQACAGKVLPDEVMRVIVERTDGVPLFIEELTAAVLEAGPGALPAMDVPSTLRDSLTARLDRLNTARDVARVGSALGREFGFGLLAQVMGQPPERLAAALEVLVEAQLLFRRGTPPTAQYVFKHALVQQAAYDGQLRGDRQALHARIVDTIEMHEPELAQREPALMAHHCEQAQRPDRQADYLHAAGVASTRKVAIPEALAHFQRADKVAAALEPTPRNAARRIGILLGMMEVGRFAILPDRLVALARTARELAHGEGVEVEPTTMAGLLFQEGRAHLYTSRYHRAHRVFEEIRQLGSDTGSYAIEMKPASAYSMTLCCQGLFNETLAFIDADNIEHYRRIGAFIDYLSGLGWIGYARSQQHGDEGIAFGDRSVHEAQAIASPIYLAGAHIWRSHAHMAVRRFDDAIADARRCVELSRLHAVPYLGWHALVFLALCECRHGQFEAARRSLDEARQLLIQIEDGRWSLADYVPAIEAEMLCFQGHHARAVPFADQAIVLADELGGHFAEAMAWRVKAVCELGLGGDVELAEAFFERAMRLYERGTATAEQAFSMLVWAHALAQAGHAAHAGRWRGSAQELAHGHGMVLTRCEYGASAVLQSDWREKTWRDG